MQLCSQIVEEAEVQPEPSKPVPVFKFNTFRKTEIILSTSSNLRNSQFCQTKQKKEVDCKPTQSVKNS